MNRFQTTLVGIGFLGAILGILALSMGLIAGPAILASYFHNDNYLYLYLVSFLTVSYGIGRMLCGY